MELYLLIEKEDENIGKSINIRSFTSLEDAVDEYTHVLQNICRANDYNCKMINDKDYMDREGISDIDSLPYNVYGSGKIIKGKVFMESGEEVIIIKIKF